jgi:hypothetical protein
VKRLLEDRLGNGGPASALAHHKAVSREVTDGLPRCLPAHTVSPGQLLVGRKTLLELTGQQAVPEVLDYLSPQRKRARPVQCGDHGVTP